MNTENVRNIKSNSSGLSITAQNSNIVVVPPKPQTEPMNLTDNARRSSFSKEHDESNIPLIEHSNTKPPLARLEIEDLDDDDREVVNTPYPGVDDGFYGNGEKPVDPDVETINPDEIPEIYPRAGGDPDVASPDEPDGRNVPPQHTPNPKYPPQPFPYPPGFGPDIESGMIPDGASSIPDINVYQNKKTLAQGMMDLALLSANANQLRYVLESYDRHPYFYPSLVMISLSLIFQVAVGVGLIWNARYNVKDKDEICKANRINNFTIIGIFLITVINVFISAFGVANVEPIPAPASAPTPRI